MTNYFVNRPENVATTMLMYSLNNNNLEENNNDNMIMMNEENESLRMLQAAHGKQQQQHDFYDPHLYSWMCINFFLVFWICSHLTRQVLKRVEGPYMVATTFKGLSEDKKRNVVSYVAQIIATTIGLICQIYGGWDLLFRFESTTTLDRLEWLNFGFQVVAILYVWELCYREKIGLPLLIHHICTLLFFQLGIVTIADSGNYVAFVRLAILKAFHATFEQTSFVALFCFRLNILSPRGQGTLFYISSIQTLIFKTIVTITTIVIFSHGVFVDNDDVPDIPWTLFWKIVFYPLTLALYASQLYSSYILWLLAKRCSQVSQSKEMQDKLEDEEKGLSSDDDSSDEEEDDEEHGIKVPPTISEDHDETFDIESQPPPPPTSPPPRRRLSRRESRRQIQQQRHVQEMEHDLADDILAFFENNSSKAMRDSIASRQSQISSSSSAQENDNRRASLKQSRSNSLPPLLFASTVTAAMDTTSRRTKSVVLATTTPPTRRMSSPPLMVMKHTDNDGPSSSVLSFLNTTADDDNKNDNKPADQDPMDDTSKMTDFMDSSSKTGNNDKDDDDDEEEFSV